MRPRRQVFLWKSLVGVLCFTIAFSLRTIFVLVSGPVIPRDVVGLRVERAVQQALSQPHRVPQPRPLGNHTLTPDGLLIVNPDGPHPIFQLIRDAEAAWETKCAKGSKTLNEAVEEYQRRYRRAPPRGFDKWWDYVVKHDVQLPDEYDEIYEDIEPFWGIHPADLALTQKELEAQAGLVTVEKTDLGSHIEVAQQTLQQDRQELLRAVVSMVALVRDVELDLPPFRITVSPFDSPSKVSHWQLKAMALQAAADGTTLARADLPRITEASWVEACPPDSPARLQPPILPSPLASTAPTFPTSSAKTFIASHQDTMDPCMHPSLLTTHGQFLSYEKGPFPERTLVPQFVFCSTLLHHDIRFPPAPYGWSYDTDVDPNVEGAFEGDVPWEHKMDERLGWRGRTTGIYASRNSLWAHGHRQRVVTFANAFEGNVSLLPVPKSDEDNRGTAETVPVGEPETVRLGSINLAWMDVAFTEKAIACEKGTCDTMEKLWEFRRLQGRREEGRYKFILDVDGNGWSSRFKRLITSNALIFKTTIYPEWYMSRIAPWVHYVPIQVSYADLHDTVAFFRAHDALAERIAKAGQDWSRRFWRRQDMTAYLYRLLLEYARVSSLDRASMNYVAE